MSSLTSADPVLRGQDFRNSLLFHSPLLVLFLWFLFAPTSKEPTFVGLTIQEAPAKVMPLEEVQEKPKIIRTRENVSTKASPAVKPIFGAARQSLQSESSDIQIKAGNTVAKENDTDALPPGDQSLPVPAEEYLVTSMPKIKKEIQIPYPAGAKARSVQGPVVMNLLIDADGKVREVSLITGPDEELNAAALAAVKNIEFRPALIGEKPAPVRIRYTYRFVLEK
ncbi:MAG: TonB family protein [Bdellovibrionales bacterium]|nr:TonB family protein [Bdellovibrionales bacterium]